jgi:hypothetical protein
MLFLAAFLVHISKINAAFTTVCRCELLWSFTETVRGPMASILEVGGRDPPDFEVGKQGRKGGEGQEAVFKQD